MAIIQTIKAPVGPTKTAARSAEARPAAGGFAALLEELRDPLPEGAGRPPARQQSDEFAPRPPDRLRAAAWPLTMAPPMEPYGRLERPVDFQRPTASQKIDDAPADALDGSSLFDDPESEARLAAALSAPAPGEVRFAVNREMRHAATQTVLTMPPAKPLEPQLGKLPLFALLPEDEAALPALTRDALPVVPTAHAYVKTATNRSGRTSQSRAPVVAEAQGPAGAALAAQGGRRLRIYLSSMPMQPRDGELGALSSRFESHTGGSGAIGHDERGGTSYGRYQLSSRHGIVDAFITFLRDKAPAWSKRLAAAGQANTGSAGGAMSQVWRALAKEDPGRFEKLQHEFVLRAFYQPALERVRDVTGHELGKLSMAVREALWSAAVQHGPGGAAAIFIQAARRADKLGLKDVDYERALINEAYAVRRGRFGALSPSVQAAVGSRLKKEQSMALSMLVMNPLPPRSGEA